jgi:hypothetical protein
MVQLTVHNIRLSLWQKCVMILTHTKAKAVPVHIIWGDGGGTGITPLIPNLSIRLYCTFFNISIFGEGMFQTLTVLLSCTNTVSCPLDADRPATHQIYQVNHWTQLLSYDGSRPSIWNIMSLTWTDITNHHESFCINDIYAAFVICDN